MKITTEKIYKVKLGDLEYTFNETEVKDLYDKLGELLGIRKASEINLQEWIERLYDTKWIPNDVNPLKPTYKPVDPYKPIEVWCEIPLNQQPFYNK